MSPRVSLDFWWAAAVFVLGLVAFAAAVSTYGTLNYYEFCHYGEIARNLVEGHGFTTRYAVPSSLAYYRDLGHLGDAYFPAIDRFPLPAFFIALLCLVFGTNDVVIALAHGIAFATGCALVAFVGTKLYGRRVGLIGAGVLLLCPAFLRGYVLLGVPDVMFLCAVLPLVYLFATGVSSPRRAVFAGVLGGLAFLTRFNFALWVPLFAWMLKGKGRAVEVRAGATFAAVVLPFFFLMYLGTGSFSLGPYSGWNLPVETSATHSVEPWREFATFNALDLWIHHGGELLGKGFFAFFGEFLANLPLLCGLFVLLPFFVHRALEDRESTFIRLALAMLLIQAVPMSFLRLEMDAQLPHYRFRYFAWFAPILILGAGAALERLQAPLRTLILVLQLLAFVPAYFTGAPRFQPERYPELAELRATIPTDALVASNMAIWLTWYAGLRTMELPERFEVIDDVNRATKVDFIYLDLDQFPIAVLSRWFDGWRRDHLADFQKRSGYEVVRVLVRADRPIGVLLRRTS